MTKEKIMLRLRNAMTMLNNLDAEAANKRESCEIIGDMLAGQLERARIEYNLAMREATIYKEKTKK